MRKEVNKDMVSHSLSENLQGMDKERNAGLELLRLVLMFMVCVLHVLGQGGILKASKGTNGFPAYWFLEIVSLCAVDGFAILSGYVASDKPRKYEKLVDMWFQVVFYSLVVTAVFAIFGFNDSWGIKGIIKCALPVTYEKFWYFTAYFALFFAIPVLNKFLFSISENTAKNAFIIIVALFSVMGTLTDPFHSNSGYAAIWLMVLYCVGVLAKRIHLFEAGRTVTLLFWWILCIIVTWLVRVYANISLLTSYLSPTILLSGMILVVLFSRISVKGTIIPKLSPLAFGIYLFQLNQVIWVDFLKDAFIGLVEKPLFLGVVLVFIFAFGIFLSGLVVEFIRSKLAKLLGIHSISKFIVVKADFILGKLAALLK